MSVYALLDQDARRWWYHLKLRKEGNEKEARRKEREEIRSHVRMLRAARECGYLSVGRGGWSLHWAEGDTSGTLQGYGGMASEISQCALILGIPVIDSTTIPDDRIAVTVSLPLISLNRERVDKPPWGGMSYAPLREVAGAYKALGAAVYNLKLLKFDPKRFRAMTKAESKALRSFESGDELSLFEAMIELREEG